MSDSGEFERKPSRLRSTSFGDDELEQVEHETADSAPSDLAQPSQEELDADIKKKAAAEKQQTQEEKDKQIKQL